MSCDIRLFEACDDFLELVAACAALLILYCWATLARWFCIAAWCSCMPLMLRFFRWMIYSPRAPWGIAELKNVRFVEFMVAAAPTPEVVCDSLRAEKTPAGSWELSRCFRFRLNLLKLDCATAFLIAPRARREPRSFYISRFALMAFELLLLRGWAVACCWWLRVGPP